MNNEAKARAFADRMIGILNAGALNFAISAGYRTGLFDVMSRFDSARPAGVIAGAAGLDERYVREWLGVMMAGGVVEITGRGADAAYYLPPEHAACLTREAGNGNLGVYAQEIPLLTTLAGDRIVESFKTGDGIPYEFYPRFQEFMTELSNAKLTQVLVDRFLPSVDEGRLVERLRAGITVCDMGCGEGLAVLLMAEAFPESRFVGLDISGEAVNACLNEMNEKKLANVEFMVRDAARLHHDASLAARFDYVLALDAIHDQTRPLEALKAVRHILKPDGLFSMIDIASHTDHIDNRDHPMGPFLYTVSLMHCMPVGLVDGGAGLGMMWGREQAVELLAEAGFEDIRVIDMPDDPFNLHFFCRNRQR